jgi:hypothetical protein
MLGFRARARNIKRITIHFSITQTENFQHKPVHKLAATAQP